MMRKEMILLACLGVTVWAAGCRVQVDKGKDGDAKKVQVDTPFGGIHVDTGQTTAADVGLPAYPGAKLVTGDDHHKSANVRMGFGEWEMHVQVASYSSPDSEDKVVAFYRKALGSYGDVIACRDNAPVGTPARTRGGLTCAGQVKAQVDVKDQGENYDWQPEHQDYVLKAGSERRQHIVAFENSEPGETRFSLVALDLPAGTAGTGKSD